MTRKKALILGGIAAAAAIVITLVVLLLVDSFGLYRDLRAAKNSLVAAQAQITAGNLQAAALEFRDAQTHLDNAGASLQHHKISMGFARIVPVLGSQIRAADGFVSAGTHLVDAGILFTQAASGIPGLDATVVAEQPDIGRMTDIMVKFGNDLAPVQEALNAASSTAQHINGNWLVNPISGIKRDLDQRLADVLESVTTARELIPAFAAIMGTPGEPASQILLLQQNCFELRPSGGLISSYGILQVTHDSMALPEFGRTATGIPQGLNLGNDAPYPWGYISPVFFFRDAGWWPDFPMTVNMLDTIWAANGRAPVKGYIAFDPIAIQYGLEKLGPLAVPEFNATVTADNLMQEIASHAASSEEKESFVKSLGNDFFNRVVNTNPRDWFALGQAMHKALQEKHLILYFNDPSIQQVFSKMDWSGELHQPGGDYLMAVDGNLGISTLGYEANLLMYPSMDVSITRQADGTLLHTVTYNVDNSAAPMDYWSYLRVYVPADAVAQANEEVLNFGLEDGKLVLGRSVYVAAGSKGSVAFTYSTPAYDSLFMEKQAGQRTLPVTLSGSLKRSIMLADQFEQALR